MYAKKFSAAVFAFTLELYARAGSKDALALAIPAVVDFTVTDHAGFMVREPLILVGFFSSHSTVHSR